MDTRANEENGRDGHRHAQLETVQETVQRVHVLFWGDNLENMEQEVEMIENYSSIPG